MRKRSLKERALSLLIIDIQEIQRREVPEEKEGCHFIKQ